MAQQPQLKGELFNLSGSCAAPDAAVTSLAPLPNLASTLMQRMNVRVLAVGDWISSGNGMMGQNRFTAELEEILERSVKNLDLAFTHRGSSGESMTTTDARLKDEVALQNPDLILWQLGTYDAVMRMPVAEFEATLSGAVEWIKSHNIDVVLVGLQYTKALSKDPHYRAMKDAVGRVAARQNVLLVRRYEAVQFMATARREQAKLEQSDFMTTELGYRCMAEHIARALVVNVFARRATDSKVNQLAKGAPAPVPAAPSGR